MDLVNIGITTALHSNETIASVAAIVLKPTNRVLALLFPRDDVFDIPPPHCGALKVYLHFYCANIPWASYSIAMYLYE